MEEKVAITTLEFPRVIPNINPGAGVLCIKLVGIKEEQLEGVLVGAMRDGIPLNTSHGRRSPFIGGARLEMLYATIRQEVSRMYDMIQMHLDSKAKKPTVNSLYMNKWCEKYELCRDELFADLGVWKRNTTLSLGISRQQGAYLFIETDRMNYHRVFREYWREDRHCDRQGALVEMLTDIAIFTALNKVDRSILYRQVVSQLGIPKSDRRKSTKDIIVYETVFSGVCYEACEFRNNISCYGGDGRTLVRGEQENEWVITGGKRRLDSNSMDVKMKVELSDTLDRLNVKLIDKQHGK